MSEQHEKTTAASTVEAPSKVAKEVGKAKKSPWRPRKAEEEQRTVRLSCAVTPAERARAFQEAERRGMLLATFVRSSVISQLPPEEAK